jgi:hypothetical protein
MKLKTKKNATYWINVHGGSFLVKPMSLSEEEDIERRNLEYDTKGNLITKHQFRAKVHTVLQDWGPEIEDEEGNKLSCTTENIDLLTEENTKIATDILREASRINGETQRASEKNS